MDSKRPQSSKPGHNKDDYDANGQKLVFEVPCTEQAHLITAYRYIKQERFAQNTPFNRKYFADVYPHPRIRFSDAYFKQKQSLLSSNPETGPLLAKNMLLEKEHFRTDEGVFMCNRAGYNDA